MFKQYILSSSTSTIFTIHHLRRLLLLKYKLIKLPRNQSLVHEQHYVFHLFLEQIITQNQSIRSNITTVSWIISQSQSPANLSGFRISGPRIRRSQSQSQLHVGCACGGLEVLLSPMFQALHDFVGHQLVEHGIQPPRALIPGTWISNWPSGEKGSR